MNCSEVLDKALIGGVSGNMLLSFLFIAILCLWLFGVNILAIYFSNSFVFSYLFHLARDSSISTFGKGVFCVRGFLFGFDRLSSVILSNVIS